MKKLLERSSSTISLVQGERTGCSSHLTPSLLHIVSILLSTICQVFTEFPIFLENEHFKRPSHPTANRAVVHTCPAGEQSLYLIGLSHTSSASVSLPAEDFPPAWGAHAAKRAWACIHNLAWVPWLSAELPQPTLSKTRTFSRCQ